MFPNVFIFLPFRLQWWGEDSLRLWLVPMRAGVDFLRGFHLERYHIIGLDMCQKMPNVLFSVTKSLQQ